MPLDTLWRVPFPPFPRWVRQGTRLWGPEGQDTDYRTMRNKISTFLPTTRSLGLAVVAVVGRALPVYESHDLRFTALRRRLQDLQVVAEDPVAALEKANRCDRRFRRSMDRTDPSALDLRTAVQDGFLQTAVRYGFLTFVRSSEVVRCAHAVAAVQLTAEYAAVYAADERRQQNHLFGLMSPGVWNPAWSTSTARGLAEGIYADQAYDRLPILADALEDAGCDDLYVLRCCRELPAACCFRGMWFLDAARGVV
jgi:hypothetical protein